MITTLKYFIIYMYYLIDLYRNSEAKNDIRLQISNILYYLLFDNSQKLIKIRY